MVEKVTCEESRGSCRRGRPRHFGDGSGSGCDDCIDVNDGRGCRGGATDNGGASGWGVEIGRVVHGIARHTAAVVGVAVVAVVVLVVLETEFCKMLIFL